MKSRTIIIIISALLSIVILGGITAFIVYTRLNSPAFEIQEEQYIYIDEKKNYQEVIYQLENTAHLLDPYLFMRIANFMKYPENIKSGRYRVTPEMSYLEAVRLLRSGRQEPVRLTFNNIRLKEDFAKRIGAQLAFNKDDLLFAINDPEITSSYGFDTLTIVAMFIPNTYEVYWNISIDDFLNRMKKEYERFWNPERKIKADNIHLSPIEVTILASIVEEETAVPSEYTIVAGLYLNRLKKQMLLQADPTVKFAVGDVTLRRILFHHLEIDSPYNTYRYPGLPPGPIRIPSIQAINGVLNYQTHSYLYMCAKEDFSGTHNFAQTLKEHNRNAKKYQAALNRAGIK